METLNATVWATLGKSDIQGIGVFAIRAIPKGTTITDHSVHFPKTKVYVLKLEEFNKILPEIRDLILDRIYFEDDDTFVFHSPNTNACLQSFMNHADDNNSDGKVALRDIKKGEEITEDYKSMLEGKHQITQDHYSWLK